MKKYLCFIFFVTFFNFGCTNTNKSNVYLMYQDAGINYGVRSQITNINTKVFKALLNDDYQGLAVLVSDSFKIHAGKDFEQNQLIKYKDFLRGKTDNLFSDFYVKNSTTKGSFSLNIGTDDKAYFFNYLAVTKEVYISMHIVGDSTSKIMLTSIYGNYDGKWQLYSLTGYPYSYYNKAAPDYYKDALNLYNKGDIVDAAINMEFFKACDKPVGDCFEYKNDKESSAFLQKIINEFRLKYPMPYTLEYVTTKPKVFKLTNQLLRDRWVPLMCYLTTIPLSDTISLQKENQEMQNNIDNVFNGFDRNNTIITYQAYNTIPEIGKPNQLHYQFVKRKDG